MRRGSERKPATRPAAKISKKCGIFRRFRNYVRDVHTPSNAGESYEQKELRELIQRIKDFHSRFGYAPAVMVFSDAGQATPVKRPEPVSAAETLLSRTQVARRWGCSTETVKRRERDGILKSVSFNSRYVRYRLEDVEHVEQQAGSLIKGS